MIEDEQLKHSNDGRPREGLTRVAEQPRKIIENSLFEYPLSLADTTEYRTPEEKLFVLAHLGVPSIEIADWKLAVTGLVNRSLSLTYDQLSYFPKYQVTSVHQCAGNPLNPAYPTRTISNLEWNGVLLREVLAHAGVQTSATHVWAFGLDFGELQIEEFRSEPQQHYVKDIPLDYVMTADVLLATHLNGRPLSEKHGFPARLVVPGFYGHNSVKWLCRLQLENRRADGLFTTELYNDSDPLTGGTKPVWKIAPESIIVTPAEGSAVAGPDVEIAGWAWSYGEVRLVEISTDDGTTWHRADVEPRRNLSWQRFRYCWFPPGPGQFNLTSRTTDIDGQVQPMSHARNAVHQIVVTVR